MDLPRVSDFCFCISLRCGSIIVGYITLVSALLSLILEAVFIALLTKYVSEHKDNPPEGHTTDDVTQTATKLYVIYSFQLLIFLCYITLSILLIIGVHKNRPKFLRYFFVAGLVNLIADLVLVAGSFVFTGYLMAVLQLLFACVKFYFLLVVRSTYLDVEERSKPSMVEMKLYDVPQAVPLVE